MWHAGSVAEEAIFLTQIQQGLKDLGYVEGRNVTLVNTFAGDPRRTAQAWLLEKSSAKLELLPMWNVS